MSLGVKIQIINCVNNFITKHPKTLRILEPENNQYNTANNFYTLSGNWKEKLITKIDL